MPVPHYDQTMTRKKWHLCFQTDRIDRFCVRFIVILCMDIPEHTCCHRRRLYSLIVIHIRMPIRCIFFDTKFGAWFCTQNIIYCTMFSICKYFVYINYYCAATLKHTHAYTHTHTRSLTHSMCTYLCTCDVCCLDSYAIRLLCLIPSLAGYCV